MKTNTNYFKVVAKCGHVGRKAYVPIQFPVRAENGREAARIVRDFPRVKHQHKDAILLVKKIDLVEYLELKEINRNDPYLHCHSHQEQNQLCDMASRMMADSHYVETKKYDKHLRQERILFKQKKNKELICARCGGRI